MSRENKKAKDKSEKKSFYGRIFTIIVVILAMLQLYVTFGYRKVSRTTFKVDSGVSTLSESSIVEADAQDETELVLIVGENETEFLQESIEESEINEALETDAESGLSVNTDDDGGKLVVAIDPGHQGSWVDMSDQEPLGPGSSEMKAKASTGTQGSYSHVPEYELNLEISLLLRNELEERGYEVVLTREDNDTTISNAERALLAYEQGGDIYVRIHANGSENASVAGALAMVPSSSNPYVGDMAEDSYFLAECILNAYCDAAGFDSLGIQYSDNMTGINWSKIPVMILEMGFMTNESDDLRMNDEDVQLQMVQGIADGIDNYFIEKGMKEEVSSSAFENYSYDADMNYLEEMIGEGYVYPASDFGETWAVSVLDLNSGYALDVNGDVRLKSASVLKVFIMAAFYDRVLTPSSEEKKIVVDEYTEEELYNLISRMITVSDNDAANTLVTLLGKNDASAGMDEVNAFLEENNFMGTSMGRLFLEETPSGDNYTTSNDCMRLLESIFEGTCVSEFASAQMYEYLKQQTLVGKIPSALTDEDAIIANKTGELAGDYDDYVENDVAIVVSGETSYILCILSNDLQDNNSAVSRITQISELVYETLDK